MIRFAERWAGEGLVCVPEGGVTIRAVTVADFYHRGGNGPTTAGGAVLYIYYIYVYIFYIYIYIYILYIYIYIYIYNSETQK